MDNDKKSRPLTEAEKQLRIEHVRSGMAAGGYFLTDEHIGYMREVLDGHCTSDEMVARLVKKYRCEQ